MRGIPGRVVGALAMILLMTPLAWAQGGGASSTGTIQGRVVDAQGGVLPGVTVTATSPSMMGVQTQVTSDSGNYRFPAVPPGVYTVTFELPGFSSVKREGISIALGFTATLNIELNVASLQETVTVTGETPLIDTSATRVQQNYKLEDLQSLPGARDMWSLLSVTPAVQMTRTDVGGNRAGTQTGYTAYGFTGQTRVLVEGINTTEGTGGAGFYFDFGSFEEVFLGTAGQGAEMPHPGVQSQFLGKSGGNSFQGQIYADVTRNALQGSNISDDQIATGLREGSNEMSTYRDLNVNLGGPIKRDRVWWYFSYRDQKNEIEQPSFRFDKLFETRLWNPSGKVTYQASQNHKLIGYYQWGQKIQPNRTFSTTFFFEDVNSTRNQDSGSWVYKGEWNGTLSNKLYVEARYGEFGYYFPLVGYGDEPWREDSDTRIATGGDQRQQLDRQRRQLTGAATYFVDRALGGSHSVKVGGELNLETGFEGYESLRPGNVRHYFINGVSRQVDIAFPTASCEVGSLGARECLLAISKLDHQNAFISDTWTRGRLTLNLGLRWDRYKSHVPDQQQLASTTAGFSVPEIDYPAQTFFVWNSVVPRVGGTYDLTGNGKTVVKVSYGFFRHNPGITPADDANPNQPSKFIRYQWNDRNGDRLFQFGEHGNVLQDNLTGGQIVDPDIRQPRTHEVSAFVEHQLMESLGVRVGYVDKRSSDLFQLYSYLRPPDLYTQPFTFLDLGEDGIRDTADDRQLSLLGIPSALVNAENAQRRVQNTIADGRYQTIEASLNKRMSNRWSVGFGFGYTWTAEFQDQYRGNTVSPGAGDAPNTPNDTSYHEFTTFGFNAFSSLEGPWGLRFSPVLRFTQGSPWGRTVTVNSTAPLFSGTILVEPLGTRRMDDIVLLDLKTEKSIPLGGSRRLNAFIDLFNMFNSNAADTISFATGSTFGDPTNIIGPFTARIGARLEW
jgi:hypothetical protein